MKKIFILIFLFILCSFPANAERVQVFGGGGSGSVSDTVYGAGWNGDTTVAPSKNAVYDKIETIASGGDNISVNSTGATNANFLDNLYIDFAIDTAATPNDITSKFNYAETLAGNPALLTTECIFMADGLMCEGTTADAIEMKLAFPDPATTDKTITLPNATDTLIGKDTTDTLTNKTMAAANNVLDADTAVALAADPADCGANTFATTIAASGALTCASIGDADVPNTITIDLAATVTTNANLTGEVTSVGNAATIADSVTVTGWVLGTSTASSLASPIFVTNNADPADAGIFRLGNAESIAWESAPAGTDITLSVDASEIMQVSGALNAVGAITGSNLSGTNTGDNTVATTGDSATSFFSSGTLEVAIGGTGTTTSTGTGAVVLGTSPTIATPALTLQDGNGAAPTTDGVIKYDRTAEVLQVGDGTITRSFPSSKVIAGFSITNGNTAIDATVTDPVACQRIANNSVITGWYIDCDASGSIVLDVWKNTWDDTPEVNGDSIAGTEKPTLSTDVSASDTALGSMTTDWNSGQNVCIEIESATTVTKCRVQFVGYLD